MFGSHRQLNASSISTRILRCTFYYAIFLGVTCFQVKRNRSDGRLVARNRYWYKLTCLLIRIPMSYFYLKAYKFVIFDMEISHMKIQMCVRLFGCLLFIVCILVMQFYYGQQVLRLINNFLRLFWKLNGLPGGQCTAFGGKRELSLLIFKAISLMYELYYLVLARIFEFNITSTATLILEVYTSLSTGMFFHIVFMGYLSVSALYEQVNSYVRHELRQQLCGLKQSNSRRQLEEAGYRLDECLAIYVGIQRVTSDFQRLFELPLCLILLFFFLNMALFSSFILLHEKHVTQLGLLVIKIFVDLFLLVLAIYGAQSSSRVVRRLSLENYCVNEGNGGNDWQMKLEMFLSRLNYYEFRVRPLGLFEVSNELILLFISGMITYLTYIIQYSMQSKQM